MAQHRTTGRGDPPVSKAVSIKLPLWKRILFSIVPAALFLVLLVLAEFVARWASPVPPERLVDEVQFDGITWYQTNRSFLKKYFPAGTPLVPEFKTGLFRKEKTGTTFRVMCLGGSTMFGTPYDMNANIQGILRRQLRHRYPSLEWEVINWGASAINSNVIRDLADDLLAFTPDLVIIYMGHNEYYGPDGIGASFPERYIPSLTPLKYRMRELRLVQIVQQWIAGAAPDAGSAGNLMRQVSGGSLVPTDSEENTRVLQRFEANLSDILETFSAAQIPVVISDVASNLLFPPFAGDSVIGSRNTTEFDLQMRKLSGEGRYDEMLDVIHTLSAPDTLHPFALYWKGFALRATGHPKEARELLLGARDQDLLKFRAPRQVNTIIHAASTTYHIPLVAADSLLGAGSGDGIPDETMFWEHLHPTPAGYSIIASGFLETITKSGIVRVPPAVLTQVPFHMDSLRVCWLDLAYGDFSIQRLTGKWPFESYARTPLVLLNADPQQLSIVRDTYARVLQWNEACYASAKTFWRMGRLRDALTTYEAMLEEYPYSFYTNYLAGSLLNTMGEGDRAIGYLKQSISANPEYLPPRLDLGLLDVNHGRYAEALVQLQAVVDQAGTTPEQMRIKANALYGIGAACANQGDMDRAAAAVDQALLLQPGYTDALRLKEAIRKSK